MLRHTPATSVSARLRPASQSPQKSQPRADAAGAYALLRRMTTGRWPVWRLLGTAAPARDLIVGVEWLRGSSSRYAVATISPDGRALSWTACESSGDVIDRLEEVPVPAGRREVA